MKLAHYSEEAAGENIDDVDECSHGLHFNSIHQLDPSRQEAEIVSFFKDRTDCVEFDGRKCEECQKVVLDWENKTVQQYISTMHKIFQVAKKNRPSFDDKKFGLLLKGKKFFDSIDNDPDRPWMNLFRKVSSLLTKKDFSIGDVYKGLHGAEATVPEDLKGGSKTFDFFSSSGISLKKMCEFTLYEKLKLTL